jgi:hypothetical protein
LIDGSGNALYVADSARGLVVFDVSEVEQPVRVRGIELPGAAAWLAVAGEHLHVLAAETASLERFDGSPSATTLFTFDIGTDALEPRLLSSQVIEGVLREARVADADGDPRLIVLTQANAAPSCTALGGYPEYATGQEGMIVSEVQFDAGVPSVTQQEIDGDGYLGAETAFVITRGWAGGGGDAAAVIVVDFAEPGVLEVLDEVRVEAHLASSPVFYDGNRLAFVSLRDGLPLFNHIVWNGAEVERSVVVLPSSVGSYQGVEGEITERFAVLSSESAGAVVVDVTALGGPLVTAELPAEWGMPVRAGEQWLVFGQQGTASFEIDASGEPQIGPGLDTPALGMSLSRWYDAEQQQLYVTYFDLPGTPYLGVFDVSGDSPSWDAGTALSGDPQLIDFGGGLTALPLFSKESSVFAVTHPNLDGAYRDTSLERFSATDAASQRIELGDLPMDVAHLEDTEARLLRGPAGPLVSLLQDGSATIGPLSYRTERLLGLGDVLLAYSLHYDNSCYRGDYPLPEEGKSDESECTKAGTPAISVVSPEGELRFEVPLPEPAVELPTDTTLTWEWNELVVSGDRVGLLQRRGWRCVSAEGCAAMGIEAEMDDAGGGAAMCDDESQCPVEASEERVSGYRDDQWYYPFDVGTGRFDEPFQVGEATGYNYLTSDGIRSSGEVAFYEFTVSDTLSSGTVSHGVIQLVSADLEQRKAVRTTLQGFPLTVDGPTLVSIEPRGGDIEQGVAADVDLHVQELFEGEAYVTQTLSIGRGHGGHRWHDQRGYVLLYGDDRCAEPTTELVAVELAEGQLVELGRLTLDGTDWHFAGASDSRVVLVSERDRQAQLAVVSVGNSALELIERALVPWAPPVSVDGERVVVGARADRLPVKGVDGGG